MSQLLKILPLETTGDTCDVHIGKKAEFELEVRSRSVAKLCPECLKDLFREIAENTEIKELREIIAELNL